jgi:hypothetical protein
MGWDARAILLLSSQMNTKIKFHKANTVAWWLWMNVINRHINHSYQPPYITDITPVLDPRTVDASDEHTPATQVKWEAKERYWMYARNAKA